MQITSFKFSMMSALCTACLTASLVACGGGGGGGSPAASTPALPTGAVAISGTASQGETLSVASGTLADADGLGTISYQWLAGGVPIAGATSATFTLTSTQVGKVVSVQASYVDGKGNPKTVTQTLSTAVILGVGDLPGIWNGTVGGGQASAVILSNGNAWIVANNAGQVQLYTATLSGTDTVYTGSGKQFISGSAAAPIAVSFAPTVVSKASLGGTLTPAGQAAQTLSFTYDSRYQTAAALADVTGKWQGTKSAGAVVVTWDVSAAGALTGSSTAGCTYTGALAVHSSVGVFDLTLNETCAATVKAFTGIVTLNAAKTSANFAFATANGSEGDIQSTNKQP